MKMNNYLVLLIVTVILIFACTDSSTSPEDEELKKPANLVLQQIDNTSILLNWEDRSNDETGFILDRKLDISAWENDFQIFGEGATGYLDTNLTVFGEYHYRLSAYNELEETEAVISLIQFRDLDSLNAPTNLMLHQIEDFSIMLSWNDNSSAEEGFCIDRKIGDNAWEENSQILDANSTMFIDEDLITIEDYTYRVKAFIGDDFSDTIENEIYFSYNDVEVISIEFNQNPFQINPSPILIATLFDEDMNLVTIEYPVWFKIVSGPEGMNINNVLFGIDDSLFVQSEDGQAVVSLNAGIEPGYAAVEVFVYNLENERISSIKSNILINSAGPPENIEIIFGGFDSGLNMGGGVWQIEVAAIINDINGNPCDYGTPVWFELTDPQYPGTDPDWATIGAEAYIGNENANGDSLVGVAFSVLNYEGSHTNDSLLIHVEVSGTTSTLVEEVTITAPLQFGEIDLVATPAHLDWIQGSNTGPKETTIRVQIIDGQNNLINGQLVYFACPAGMPIGGIDPYIGLTGNVNGVPGLLYKQYSFQKYECPPPPPIPGQVTYNVEVKILGTGASDTVPVTLYRYVD
jgi:hypothetical protein